MNKHDELLRKIEELPSGGDVFINGVDLYPLAMHHANFTTDELQSLAADFGKMLEKNEKMEQLLRDLEPAIAYAIKNTWTPKDYERYAELQAQQSGEEGE